MTKWKNLMERIHISIKHQTVQVSQGGMVVAPAPPSCTSPGEGGGGGGIPRFGYLARPAPGLAPLHTEAALAAALATFQQFGGINVTGELDRPTLELMATPRCGVQDVPDNLLEDIQILDVGEEEEGEEGEGEKDRRGEE